MPKKLFPVDDRIAYCACGWGEGERKTVSQVTGHRARVRFAACADPMVIVDDDPHGTAHDDLEDEDEDEEAQPIADATVRTSRANGKSPVEAGPTGRAKSGASGPPSRVHYGEFTPVSTARFIAPALLHSYYDWFCKGDPAAPGSAYEGDFQTWLCTLALDCLKEHWGLDFAVTIMPRTGGNTNGQHAT